MEGQSPQCLTLKYQGGGGAQMSILHFFNWKSPLLAMYFIKNNTKLTPTTNFGTLCSMASTIIWLFQKFEKFYKNKYLINGLVWLVLKNMLVILGLKFAKDIEMLQSTSFVTLCFYQFWFSYYTNNFRMGIFWARGGRGAPAPVDSFACAPASYQPSNLRNTQQQQIFYTTAEGDRDLGTFR